MGIFIYIMTIMISVFTGSVFASQDDLFNLQIASSGRLYR